MNRYHAASRCRSTRILLAGLICIVAACTQPLSPKGPDLLELERVWQYLKVYSIWQERIGPDPTEYTSTEEMISALHDTLYTSYSYTQYPITEAELARMAVTSGVDSGSVHLSRLSSTTTYFRIDGFKKTPISTSAQLAAVKDSSLNIIIDLRKNGGGNVDVCTSSIELFLPSGVPYISATYRLYNETTRDTATVRNQRWFSRQNGNNLENRRYAILIDSTSASAAEIFAAALRDGLGPEKVLLIGKRSYGKGIGQYLIRLRSMGNAIQITGFRFHRVTPIDSLRDYNQRGIEPDVSCPDDSIPHILARWFDDSALSTIKSPLVLDARTLPSRPGRLLKEACYREIDEHDLP